MFYIALNNLNKMLYSLDKNLLAKKLTLMDGYISELEPIIKLDEKSIKNDSLKYHTAERLFQLLVDEMIDVNIHIIRAEVLPPPDDIQGTFAVLGKAGIFPEDFVLKISPIVGLRNAIVHRYEHVDLDRFVHELKRNFNDFKLYCTIVAEKFIKLTK